MPAEHSTRRRVIYFDILRIVAIFFVVFVHLAAQHWSDVDVSSRAWFAFNLYCTTGKWSVPIFVMISGALFLGRRSASLPSSKRMSRASPRSFSSGLPATRSSTLSFVTRRFGRAFPVHHGALSSVVPLHDRRAVFAHSSPAAHRSERNAYALLPAAGAYLYVSSPSACPVFLLYLAAAKRCDQKPSACIPTAIFRSASRSILSADTI